jgi:hypothetical protein
MRSLLWRIMNRRVKIVTQRFIVGSTARATLAVFSFVLGPASGQSVLALVKPPYNEKLNRREVFGDGLVVGLQLEQGGDHFMPGEVYVQTPKEAWGHTVCVTVASRDGSYTAENLYNVPANNGSFGKLDVMGASEKARALLSSSSPKDVAVRARIVPNCNSIVGQKLLLSHSGPLPLVSDLLVNINAKPDEIQRVLLPPLLPLGPEDCLFKESDTNTAFSSTCRFHLKSALAAGEYTLTITMRDRLTVLPDRKIAVLIGNE